MDLLEDILSGFRKTFPVKKAVGVGCCNKSTDKSVERLVATPVSSRSPLKVIDTSDRLLKESGDTVMRRLFSSAEPLLAAKVERERQRQRAEASRMRHQHAKMTASSQLDVIFEFDLFDSDNDNDVGIHQLPVAHNDWKSMDVESLHLDFCQFNWERFRELDI